MKYVVLVCILCLIGCERNISRPVSVIVSGDTAGWIVPCGCTSNQSGGLPRRGTFIEQRRKIGPVIVVDVGGTPGGTSIYDSQKFKFILQGENETGLSVHNIGRGEAELFLQSRFECSQTPWISANTTFEKGNPAVKTARIVEAGGRKFLFIGIMSQKYQVDGIRISPPRQAVLKEIKDHAKMFDHVVVLAYVPEDELRELAESLPEVDAVVGGPTGQPVPPSRPQGTVLMTSATKQGKFLAVLNFDKNQKGVPTCNAEIVELDERFADDPKQLDIVRQFREELKAKDFSPDDTPFVDRNIRTNTTDAIAGTKSCQTCHEEEYRVWSKSRHATAWQSLVGKESQFDPDCQRCHVTGYGANGGFVNVAKSKDRVDVGCESCHGYSAEHCKKTSIRTEYYERAKDRCLICHDRENSPKFEFESYWNKIRHGQHN